MKRLVTAALALAFVGMTAPGQASAQISIGVGGGASFPTGDYGDYANTGWIGSVGITVPVGTAGLGVGATGFYGSNNHSDVDGDKTNLLGGVAGLSYGFETSGSLTPYILGAVGFLRHSYKSDSFPDLEDSVSGMAFGGGVGVRFPLGSISGRLQGTYLQGTGDVDGTKFFAVGAGVSFPIGGDSM
jgi:hypothetical protein